MLTFPSLRMGRVVLAAALALSATGAIAAGNSDLFVAGRTASDAHSITIAVQDLDLASTQGRNTLAIRVNNAAQAVCDIHDSSQLDRLSDAQACFQQARSSALAQLDSRGLGATAALSAAGLR